MPPSSAPPCCSIPARRVFVELDDGIDAIWRDRKTRGLHPVLASLKSRLLALALMVVLGVLLIAVILTSVLISAYAGALEAFPILGEWIGPAMSGFVHYGLLVGFLHPDLQMAADRRRAVEIRVDRRRR